MTESNPTETKSQDPLYPWERWNLTPYEPESYASMLEHSANYPKSGIDTSRWLRDYPDYNKPGKYLCEARGECLVALNELSQLKGTQQLDIHARLAVINSRPKAVEPYQGKHLCQTCLNAKRRVD